jgi:hypothetical protein
MISLFQKGDYGTADRKAAKSVKVYREAAKG